MPTIMDALNAQQAQPADLAATTGTGQTKRLSDILAQTSGKQAGATPSQNFAEQAAVGGAVTQAKQAEGAQAVGVAQQQNQAAGQAAAGTAAQAATTQQVSADNQKYVDQASQILSSYENGGKQIDLERDQAGAQQLAFNMRLSNQQYTARLQQEGQMRRLEDSTSFEQQTAESVMGQQLQTLGQHLDWETAMTANEDQWNTDLQNVSLGEWMQMAQLGAQQASTAAAAQGASGIISGGAKAYANYTPSAEPTVTEQAPDTSTGVGDSSQPNFNGPPAPAAGGT